MPGEGLSSYIDLLLATYPSKLNSRDPSLIRNCRGRIEWRDLKSQSGLALLGPTPQHCAFVNGSAYGTFLRVCITARPISLRAVWLINGPPINFKRLYSRLETTSRGRLSGHLKRFLERLTNHAGEVTGYLSRPQKPHRRPQSRPHRRPSDSLLVDLLPNRVGHLRYSVILRTMSSRPAL